MLFKCLDVSFWEDGDLALCFAIPANIAVQKKSKTDLGIWKRCPHSEIPSP